MSICITAIIEKDTAPENFLDFYKGLQRTSGDYDLCVVNNSENNFRDITDDGVDLIQNAIDPGFVTAANQGLHFSYSSGYDYTIVINSSYTIVAKEDWLKNIFEEFGEDEGVGGNVFPVKVTGTEQVGKVLYSISPSGDISWLSQWLNRYMITTSVDSNIFVINNKFLSDIQMPNSAYCTHKLYGFSLSLSFMKIGKPPVHLNSIYSSQNDVRRYDIFEEIKEGAGIVYPVIIDSVRKRFIN